MKRKDIPEVLFQPASDIQEDFIWSTKRESMFDGGVGNGKTTGALMRLLILAREFPGSRWVVARQTYKTLMNTTYKTFERVCPTGWVKRFVKENMTLANGSEILWLHLDELSEEDMKSLEINGACVSQAEEIAPEMWDFLDSRIGRWYPKECVWSQPCPAYIWGECNPNGHDWIYFRFHPEVVSDHPQRAYYFGATSINRVMLEKFSPGYYDNLMRKPEQWKRRWVYGSRDIFEGAIHPEFKGKIGELHVYDADRFDPFERCDIKSCWGWFDYGLSAPTCMLISASTTDNFHFITSEYYRRSTPGRTVTIREHASALLKLMRDNRYTVRGVYGDPSMFKEDARDRQTRYTSVAKEYQSCGFYIAKADNNEVTSISNIQEMLHVDASAINPITRKLGSPRLFISSRCPNLIEQIQLQRHAETRNPLTGDKEFTEERAEGIPDHAYDPLRYFANSSVWQAPRYREQPPVPMYRVGPLTPDASKGYISSGTAPSRTKSHTWRRLPRIPEPPRVGQQR